MITWDARSDGRIIIGTTPGYVVSFLRTRLLRLRDILTERRAAQQPVTWPFGEDIALAEHHCTDRPSPTVQGVLHWYCNGDVSEELRPWVEGDAVAEALDITLAALSVLPVEGDEERGRIELRGGWEISSFQHALIILQYYVAWRSGLGVEALSGYGEKHGGDTERLKRVFWLVNWMRAECNDIADFMLEPVRTGDPRFTDEAENVQV